MYTTRDDALEMVVAAIEAGDATRDEYDLDQIADKCFEYSAKLGGYVQVVDESGFWAAVEEAAK